MTQQTQGSDTQNRLKSDLAYHLETLIEASCLTESLAKDESEKYFAQEVNARAWAAIYLIDAIDGHERKDHADVMSVAASFDLPDDEEE